jgi:uncharacterized protein with PQ loop repeat
MEVKLKPNLTRTNKVLSIIVVAIAVAYYIPKSVKMIHWTDSGVISSYFYLLAPINLILIVLAAVTILSFNKKYNLKKQKPIFVVNLITLILMILWIPFIFTS